MPWYHHIAAFLHHNLPQMRATRRANLALLTAAILNRRALALSKLARPWMPALPQSHHQRKKLHFRFLSNPRFDPIRTLGCTHFHVLGSRTIWAGVPA